MIMPLIADIMFFAPPIRRFLSAAGRHACRRRLSITSRHYFHFLCRRADDAALRRLMPLISMSRYRYRYAYATPLLRRFRR